MEAFVLTNVGKMFESLSPAERRAKVLKDYRLADDAGEAEIRAAAERELELDDSGYTHPDTANVFISMMVRFGMSGTDWTPAPPRPPVANEREVSFTYNGVTYAVQRGMDQSGIISLPDGTLLIVTSWKKMNPPIPATFEVLGRRIYTARHASPKS